MFYQYFKLEKYDKCLQWLLANDPITTKSKDSKEDTTVGNKKKKRSKNKRKDIYVNNLCRLFNQLFLRDPAISSGINLDKLVTATDIETKLFTTMFEKHRVNIGILLIRYYLSKHDVTKATALLNKLLAMKQMRKRGVNLLIQYYLGTDRYIMAGMLYFTHLLPNFVVDAQDINMFVTGYIAIEKAEEKEKDTLLDILKTVEGLNLTLPIDIIKSKESSEDIFYSTDNTNKIKRYLSLAEKNHIRTAIYKIFQKQKRTYIYNHLRRHLATIQASIKKECITDKKEKKIYVVDGGNVMFAMERHITPDSYRRLDSCIRTINSLENTECIVVLHQRHFNIKRFAKKWSYHDFKAVNNILQSWSVFLKNTETSFVSDRAVAVRNTFIKTPAGMNDDLFIILTAIHLDAYVVTNDLFRDHIFELAPIDRGMNVIKQWVHDFILSYTITINKKGKTKKFCITLEPPTTYSRIIQMTDKYLFIPLTAGGWLGVCR